MNDTTIGQRIGSERKKLGLSQEALGEKMGVSRQAISKWEADAAVPEIDKLIALSKLFGVSVGWLLGVEEQTESHAEELNETQLKMVEEIVRRYQPQPVEKPKRPWYIPVLICITAVIGILAISDVTRTPSVDYSQQISNLQNNYTSIQTQLSSLDDRLNEIAEAAQNPSLLLSYDMELREIIPSSGDSEIIRTGPTSSTIRVDLPSAILNFIAVPQHYADSDTAYLSVLLGGSEVQRVECQRQGTGCHAQIEVPLLDGYEYCFVLRSSDGAEQVQILELPGFDFLHTNNTLHCEVITRPCVRYDGSSLEFDALTVDANMPQWLSKTQDLRWADYGFILYKNGKEIDRISHIEEGLVYDDSINFSIDLYNLAFGDSILLTEGAEIELRFFAKLSNGMECDTSAGCWVMQDGQLAELAQASEY